MKIPIHTKRRQFLTAIIAAYFTPLLFAKNSSAALQVNHYAELATKITSTLETSFDTAALGRNYLLLFPEEATITKLVTLIGSQQEEELNSLLKLKSYQLYQFLQKAQIDDFNKNFTIEVNSWVLSRTEARLYALTALS